MNFKTIFSISALVLASAVNALPVNDCAKKDALFLKWGDDTSIYTCLLPIAKFENSDNEHCVKVRRESGKDVGLYCVARGATSIPSCMKEHPHYNYNYCCRFIDAMASFKGLDIDIYPDPYPLDKN